MDDLLQKINARLQHYDRDELMALIWNFLSDCDREELAAFLNLMHQKLPQVVVAVPELEDADDLLRGIQALHDAIANDEYIQYGTGYDPDYGDYRGFGDDGWIDEMDGLFASATSLYRAGNYPVAAAAYVALFDVFGLAEDGYHFTRPDPPSALQTNLDVMKQHLFTAIGMLNPDPAAMLLAEIGYDEDDRTLIRLSSDLSSYGGNHYTLLDAWMSHARWMHGLESHLLDLCRQPAGQDQHFYGIDHAAELLRESYRRLHSLAEHEALCCEIGPQQGWPYEDLVGTYLQQEQWAQALAWADDALARLPSPSRYRPKLEEARGTALLRLNRPVEALTALQALFKRKRDLPVYLSMRAAAQTIGTWSQLYPQLTEDIEQQVLAEVAKRSASFTSESLMAVALLGFAHLLEGQIEQAVLWSLHPDIPAGWNDYDLKLLVASGLLRMGLAVAGLKPDEVLRTALGGAPPMVREHGQLLEASAHDLPANLLLDSSVRVYERLLTRAVDGRKRETYAVAGSYANIIRAIRKIQGRGSDFDVYYQSLFNAYPRLPAFKDELRTAIEGSSYKRRR